MSLHIMYDHQCSKCEAYYIPYTEGIVCPNYVLHENEVYDLVSELVHSANYQNDMYGSYSPVACGIGSFGDHEVLLIFKALDKFYTQEENFHSREWSSQLYMKNHIKDLSYNVYLEIEQQKDLSN